MSGDPGQAGEPGKARAVIAMGANLGDRRATLEAALTRLGQALGPVLAVSSFHETPPLIHPDDPVRDYPDYLNAVALVETKLAPLAILDGLQAIEAALGRDRAGETARWRPRSIDLDLIALDDRVVDSLRLTLPHAEMHKRRFVLAPMAEVWPGWRHPTLGRTTAELLAALA
jgi:2-amino-4-hydroxy-6-hydroxymethyldihydropteridine diphosphokinase